MPNGTVVQSVAIQKQQSVVSSSQSASILTYVFTIPQVLISPFLVPLLLNLLNLPKTGYHGVSGCVELLNHIPIGRHHLSGAEQFCKNLDHHKRYPQIIPFFCLFYNLM